MVGFDLDVRMLLRSSEDDILFWGEGAYGWGLRKVKRGKTETGCGRGYRRVRFPGGRRGL
mgnify:CR=1 FL=1